MRECAEAQGKDFGLIANLYVCRNGGANPRHAELLAGELDEATCTQYIDRFLMYYIQTADRLTRLSIWLEKMEGGIEHLRDLIVNDRLGIAADLERQMQFLVDTYKRERAEVVKDPEKRRLFKQLVKERDQKRPAAWNGLFIPSSEVGIRSMPNWPRRRRETKCMNAKWRAERRRPPDNVVGTLRVPFGDGRRSVPTTLSLFFSRSGSGTPGLRSPERARSLSHLQRPPSRMPGVSGGIAVLHIRIIKALTVLALSLGVVLPAVAAPASKPISSTTDLNAALKTARPINVALLEQDEVLTDMKCSEDQRKAITDLFKTAREEQEAAMRQPQVAGVAGVRVIARAIPGVTIKYDTEKLAATLKVEQLIRLRQLELHLRGPHAFADRRVIRTLGLTAEQELKAEEIIIRFEPEFSAILLLLQRAKDVDMKPLADLNEKFVGECLKLLTKEQKANWDWIVGKRPETVQWVRAIAPVSPVGNVAVGVMIQRGAIRIAPAIPVAPPVVDLPAVPPKKK